MPERNTLYVNLFGGPGAGKTTCAWEIASKLKKDGYVTEYVPEYAKELVWDGRTDLLNGSIQNQRRIFNEQYNRLQRLNGKVDIVVTDSPLPLNIIYLNDRAPNFESEIIDTFKNYNNFNIFIKRDEAAFEQEGRIHNLDTSKKFDAEIRAVLKEKGIYFGSYRHETVHLCVQNIKVHFDSLEKPQQIEQQSGGIDALRELIDRQMAGEEPVMPDATVSNIVGQRINLPQLTVKEIKALQPVIELHAKYEHSLSKFNLPDDTFREASTQLLTALRDKHTESNPVVEYTSGLGKDALAAFQKLSEAERTAHVEKRIHEELNYRHDKWSYDALGKAIRLGMDDFEKGHKEQTPTLASEIKREISQQNKALENPKGHIAPVMKDTTVISMAEGVMSELSFLNANEQSSLRPVVYLKEKYYLQINDARFIPSGTDMTALKIKANAYDQLFKNTVDELEQSIEHSVDVHTPTTKKGSSAIERYCKTAKEHPTRTTPFPSHSLGS